MDRSNAAASLSHGELIRDLGKRSDWRTQDAASERHLMERAGDPLQVWELLSRREDADMLAVSSPHLPAEAAMALACHMSTRGVLKEFDQPDSPNNFAWGEPAGADALSPLPFEPTGEDRADALELVFTPPARGKAGVFGTAMMILGTILVSTFLLFWFRFILT
ncbi:hypothetical protein [Aestuariivirga sp.]|jgi:hypothetical protein|uniref:hypothetical protein n=1 Tax=Aestuariivirga sp. TaxID=2650926 RepID=UPI003784CD8B